MKAVIIITAAGLGAAVAACTPQENLHPTFGNAVHQNMAIQIINPAPTYTTEQQIPTLDGPRASAAQTRYGEGKVIPPERLRTSDMGSDGTN